MADILINFELPWNPAKKNQRIGRIDRLGQKSNKLTIYNLITNKSIEQQIALGLLVKQSLFDGVMDSNSKTNFVDFSTKGRSQFIEQIEAFIHRIEDERIEDEDNIESAPDTAEPVTEPENNLLTNIESEYLEEVSTEEPQLSIPFEESTEPGGKQSSAKSQPASAADVETKAVELEQVMNNGMQFLAGLFKMSTGKDLGIDGQQIKVNKETGEVTMTFKLPMTL
jgi:hypothetical protein